MDSDDQMSNPGMTIGTGDRDADGISCRFGSGQGGELVPVRDPSAAAAAIGSRVRDPPPGSALRERAGGATVSAILDRYDRVLFPDQERGTPVRAEQ